MARMMNALQLALGSVGSGIQGYAQARAAREEQERLAAAFERQQQQDEEGRQVRLGELMSQGWEPVADVRRKQQDAVGAAGSLISSALNAASGNAALPMPSESAQASLAGGYAGAQPSRTIKFGGQELSLRETQPERQERLSRVAASMARAEKEQEKLERSTEAQRMAGEKKAARDSQIQTYMDVGYSRKEATMLTDNSAAMTAMRGQDISAETARAAQTRADAKADREYQLRKDEFERKETDSILRRERLPVSAQGKLAGFESGVLMVSDVRSMLSQNMEAIGPIKGRMFRSILDANDKAGVGTRAAIESLSGEIRNQRFGGALTANEAKFAESMLPSEKDEATNALKKLDQLENYLERKREGIFRVYKQPYERVNATAPQESSADALKRIRAGGAK